MKPWYLVTFVTVTGLYRTKHPIHCDHILIYCAHLTPNYPRIIHQSSLFLLHLVAKRGESGRDMAAEFCLSCLKGPLTCRKILRYGADGFTSPPKEVVLRTFIALKNRSRRGLNPRTLGPIVSTVTITPPRTAEVRLQLWLSFPPDFCDHGFSTMFMRITKTAKNGVNGYAFPQLS
jgi:hypothetical protein